jgi:DNA-binding transcriptional ArsR family regulator
MEEEFENQFSSIATLIGDKARSIMLWSLLDGRAYTATELSVCANISSQSASNHLSKMLDANILITEKQGRHRYYRYASPEIAQVIESMASLVPVSSASRKISDPKANNFTYARTCYDHLAGTLGVAIANSLVEKGILEISGKSYDVTATGNDWLSSMGIDMGNLKRQKRSFAHQCLDWSERKPHLGGALGASLLAALIQKDWIRKKWNSREILITPMGKRELKREFGIEFRAGY